MAQYGQEFKDKEVARLLPPESAPLKEVALTVGVSESTLGAVAWRSTGPAGSAQATSADDPCGHGAGPGVVLGQMRYRNGWKTAVMTGLRYIKMSQVQLEYWTTSLGNKDLKRAARDNLGLS